MSRKPTGRRNTRMICVRLDIELDADIIDWLDTQPTGRRSEAVRDMLRQGMRTDELLQELVTAVKETLSDLLQQVQIGSISQSIHQDSNAVEEAFGQQLDQLLSRF